jgi:hypothetical protein
MASADDVFSLLFNSLLPGSTFRIENRSGSGLCGMCSAQFARDYRPPVTTQLTLSLEIKDDRFTYPVSWLSRGRVGSGDAKLCGTGDLLDTQVMETRSTSENICCIMSMCMNIRCKLEALH